MTRRRCPICNSSDVEWRKRRPTDVLATWFRYGADFVFGASLKGGQFKKAGGLATYTYKDTKTFDAPNRADVSDSLHNSNTTHQALAAPRIFWHCRSCGNRGEVFAESVNVERDQAFLLVASPLTKRLVSGHSCHEIGLPTIKNNL